MPAIDVDRPEAIAVAPIQQRKRRRDTGGVRMPSSYASALLLHPDPELIPDAGDRVTVHHDFEQLFAADVAPGLVIEGDDQLLRLRVEDFSRGRISVPAVDAERDPAGLIAHPDRLLL